MIDLKMAFDSFDQRFSLWVNLNLCNAESSARIAGRILSNLDGFSHFHDCDAFAGVRAEEARIGDVLRLVL
jgi:hypothetical protein